MAGDSLAGSLGEVPAKDVATYAKAASDEAARWAKRNGVDAGAGTLAYAGTLRGARPDALHFRHANLALLDCPVRH